MSDSLPIIAVVAIMLACGALAILAIVLWRSRQAPDPHAALMDQLAHDQSEAAARLEAMIGLLAKGQTQLQHAVNERLDSVSSRLGDSLEKTKQTTAENLQKLNERLAVIDSAQKNITALASQVPQASFALRVDIPGGKDPQSHQVCQPESVMLVVRVLQSVVLNNSSRVHQAHLVPRTHQPIDQPIPIEG